MGSVGCLNMSIILPITMKPPKMPMDETRAAEAARLSMTVATTHQQETSNSGDTRDNTCDDNVNILEFSIPGYLKTLRKYLRLISVLLAGPETKKSSKKFKIREAVKTSGGRGGEIQK